MTSSIPHHDGSSLYVSNLAPALDETVRVRLRVPAGYGPLAVVRTRSNPDHEPEWTDAAPLGSADGWDWWEADVTVSNPRHGYRWMLQHESGRVEWLKTNTMTGESTSYYELTGGLNYRASANLIVRPEFRYDWSPTDFPGDYNRGIFGIDAIWTL